MSFMIVYFVAFIIGLIAFFVQVVCHVRNIRNGLPGQPFDHISDRLKNVLRMAFGQHRVCERWWGKAHFVIFYAFLAFLLGSLEVLGTTLDESWMLSQWIGVDAAGVLHLVMSYFAWLTLGALLVVSVRRLVKKSEVHSTFEAWFILALIAVLMISHLAMMCARFSLGFEISWMRSFLPLCSALSEHLDRLDGYLIHDLAAGIHVLAIAVFLVWIPRGKHLHILFAFPNLFCQHRLYDENGIPVTGCSSPDLKAYEDALEKAIEQDIPEENWPVIGSVQMKSLPRQYILNGFSCTQCRRCTNACPMVAANVENCAGPLESMIRMRTLCQKTDSELVGKVNALISADELWNCTQCGACDRACPVGNSIAARMVEMRRGRVCKEDYPPKLNAVFSHLERSGNPWGYAKSDRMKWTEHLKKCEANSKLPRILIFAGCMSSYDSAAQKTLVNCANWLMEQGFDVQTLEKEVCCGEPLRKLGKEDEFQKVMDVNLSEIEKVPHDVILTVCPHCAHVLRNEYDGAKKRLNAMHFLEFVADLYDAGMLEIQVDEAQTGTVSRVVHVPCGLGKTPETPRRLLRLLKMLGLRIVDRDITQSHCCGAGGGQFFMDNGRKITRLRVEELAAGHADEIATACPFCVQMLGDEIVSRNAQEDTKDNLIPVVNVVDICSECTHGVHVSLKN